MTLSMALLWLLLVCFVVLFVLAVTAGTDGPDDEGGGIYTMTAGGILALLAVLVTILSGAAA